MRGTPTQDHGRQKLTPVGVRPSPPAPPVFWHSQRFSEAIEDLYKYVNPKTGQPAPMIADETYNIVMANRDRLDAAIMNEKDFEYHYFGFKTLERSYLLRINGQVAERPQYMLMRVAVGIHGENIDAAIETYNALANRYFTHASPTLFNAGTPRPQLSSCFLLTLKEDSIEGIYDTLKTCAMISKTAGGIGLNIHDLRATGSYIAGTNGYSNGIVPMLKVFNNTARYVDQGGNKRPGAFAIYLEPWHADIFDFLDLRKNTGKEEHRARDLFYALWTPDLFMRRVEADQEWSLFCPNEAPGLADVWGEKFDALYEQYEREGRARKKVRAQKLWAAILQSQTETGNPYMLYKDSCNRKSNQQNLGTIRCSNLCTEIVEYSSPDEVAVCNLASIALPQFVVGREKFDHEKLFEITKMVTKNLNRIIDINYYPVPEAKKSNLRHRPIGLGVQGLADTFILLRMPFESQAARQLNKEIFETIYFAALSASVELAEVGRKRAHRHNENACSATVANAEDGLCDEPVGGRRQRDGPYETYEGSPVSKGILQFDMWNVTPTDRWDWAGLRSKIAKHGVRNSLLMAPMPTASTSQILGFNEWCVSIAARAAVVAEGRTGLTRGTSIALPSAVHVPASSRTRATSTRAACCRASSRWSTTTCCATSLSATSGTTRSRTRSSRATARSSASTSSPTTSRVRSPRAWPAMRSKADWLTAGAGGRPDCVPLNPPRSAVQDRVGDLAKGGHRHGGGPRRVHRPVAVAQHPHRRAEPRQADVDALLRLEARPQDRHVLPAHPAGRRCHQVHRRPGTLFGDGRSLHVGGRRLTSGSGCILSCGPACRPR